MKRFILMIVCLVGVGILAGCTNQTNAVETNEFDELEKKIEKLLMENKSLHNTVEEQRKVIEEQMNNSSSIIHPKNIEKYPLSLYKTTTLDLNQDGKDEMIELYVNAEKMKDGLFAWDDGQTWLLVVKDGEDTYPLFDDYVQLGSINFSTAMFEGKAGIVVLETSHSNKFIHKFVYDQDKQGFVKEILYKKENIFEHYNQPASYGLFKDAYGSMQQALTDKTVKALEASESDLQNLQKRAAIFGPIQEELWKAERLFETAAELNSELTISLTSTLNLLSQMVEKPPTDRQMQQLRSIYEVFKENEGDHLIIEEENQIHPNIQEKFRRMNIIFNGIK
ncbi:hypothetical protein KDN24_08250 [Bacillus sp. Bva_UNVM-123]|uniref:hypothetical protein n=1 Tax=Bacillus sp. Bva_UNVM-123 TaxID=2829798 RepID=UPI00391F260E